MEQIQPEAQQPTIPDTISATDALTPVKRRRSHKASVFILFGLIVIGLGIFVTYFLMQAGINPFVFLREQIAQVTDPSQPSEPTPEPEEPIIEEPEITDGTWKTYFNVNEGISVMYPPEAKLTEPAPITGTELATYKITYEGKNQEKPIVEETDVVDGYLVKIVLHGEVVNTNLDEIANARKNTYLRVCPDTVFISKIDNIAISDFAAKRFGVENCDVNYVQTFALKENNLFEIIEVYNGDIGYEQVYKNTADQIANSFTFTNTIQPTPIDTWETYNGGGNEISFKYPSELDASCCSINGPISTGSRRLIVLAHPESLVTGNVQEFDGFGVFADSNPTKMGFWEYVDLQKQLLVENYRITIGRDPENLVQEDFTIAGVTGTVLKGHAWWGDIIFIQAPGEQRIIAISRIETKPGNFDAYFTQIMETFKFEAAQ